jgi:hypothetical protein
LAVSGLTLRDAVLALKREGIRLSVAGLGRIAAAKETVKTRKSVRDGIAGPAWRAIGSGDLGPTGAQLSS